MFTMNRICSGGRLACRRSRRLADWGGRGPADRNAAAGQDARLYGRPEARRYHGWRLSHAGSILACVVQVVFAGFHLTAVELLPPGFRPLPLGIHALVGGKVVVKPGEALENGTVVIRDGLIKGVGKDL